MAVLLLPGTAGLSDVRAGKTFSAGTNYGSTGTLTDNTNAGIVITPGTTDQAVPAGITDGNLTSIKVKGDSNHIASNIKVGITDFGITGTYTSDANATAAQILNSQTAYVNGVKLTGTIPSKSAQTYTPSTIDQTIASGQYLSGNQTLQGDPDYIASNILKRINMWGLDGTATVAEDFIPGTVLVYNDPTQHVFSGTTYQLVKSVQVHNYGTVRVSFYLTGYGPSAQIYVNGVARGTVRSGSSDATYVEDITVNDGDYIQIYAMTVMSGSPYVSNFTLGISLPSRTFTAIQT